MIASLDTDRDTGRRWYFPCRLRAPRRGTGARRSRRCIERMWGGRWQTRRAMKRLEDAASLAWRRQRDDRGATDASQTPELSTHDVAAWTIRWRSSDRVSPIERPTERSALAMQPAEGQVLRRTPPGSAATRAGYSIQGRRDRPFSHWHAARSCEPGRRVAPPSSLVPLRGPRVPEGWSAVQDVRSAAMKKNATWGRHEECRVVPRLREQC